MSDYFGRWDATIHHPAGDFPSWFEINADGTGQFVGQFGNARPIPTIEVGDKLVFSLPKQYEAREDEMRFEGTLGGGSLTGSTTDGDGSPLRWSAKRAPLLPHRDVTWGQPKSLIQSDLSNWTPRSPDWEANWSIQDGCLVNSKVGSDLVLKDGYSDFKLVCEYKYPQGSNSGIYLRGRYEVQILDDFGKEPSWGSSGAVYGFLVPTVNAIHAPEEWNRCEIKLIGRWITITLNGVKVIDCKEIPGITGGALESNEGEPGTLFLQGDHGPVTFRVVEITPAVN